MDDTKLRTCLRCGEEFDSTGPGNRICPYCKLLNEKDSKKTAKVLVTHKKPIMEED